jgi:hypothetical protein
VHRMFSRGFLPVTSELTVIIEGYDIEFILSLWWLVRDCLDVQLHTLLNCVFKSQFLCLILNIVI